MMHTWSHSAAGTRSRVLDKASSSLKSGGGDTVLPSLQPAGKEADRNAPGPLHISKLEAEVVKLETRGNELVQMQGKELEGLTLLEKSLNARSRFPVLNVDAWQRAEHFVVLCNQLAVRSIHTLEDRYEETAREILQTAERVLCGDGNDALTGFHPLRQHLLGATLSNVATLHVVVGKPLESALEVLEKSLAAEMPRPSTLLLFNLAAIHVRLGRFDDAMKFATRTIALADHYLRLHVNPATPEAENALLYFHVDSASHAVLAHHLIVSVAVWSGQGHIAQHHAKLALRCAERYMGQRHALTSRALHRLYAVRQQMEDGRIAHSKDPNPPEIALQLATFAAPYPPSKLLPFTLIGPLPASVLDLNTDSSKLPLIYASSPVTSSDAKRTSTAVTSRASLHQPHPPLVTGSAKWTPRPPGPPKGKPLLTSVPRAPSGPPAAHVRPRLTAGQTAVSPPEIVPAIHQTAPPAPPAGDPIIDGWGIPAAPKVSVVAKRDFEIYTALQAEVASFVQRGRTPASATTPSQQQHRGTVQPPRTTRRGGTSYDGADVDAAVSSYFSAEEKLKKLSCVLPDHTDADEVRWDAAARCLQRWTHVCLARLALRRKVAARDKYVSQVQAAYRILEALLRCTEEKTAMRVVEERRHRQRCEDALARVLLPAARSYISYLNYCRRVEAALTARLKAERLESRRTFASVGIQSFWRSYAVRKRLRLSNDAAVRIQRFYRVFRAYMCVRLIVFGRREAKRLTAARRDRAALRLQIWWTHLVKALRAKRLLDERRRQNDACSAHRIEHETLIWLQFAPLDEDKMSHRITRFFRWIAWTRREARRQVTLHRIMGAASRIQRAYRWSKASMVRERRREVRHRHRVVQKRKEEVAEAVHDIQSIARGYLGRMLVVRLRHAKHHRERAALVLQRFAKMIQCARQKADRRALRDRSEKRYQTAVERRYAATKIQSIYRMRRDRAMVVQYRQFMSHGRHVFANRIVRAWRLYAARRVRAVQWRLRNAERRQAIHDELRTGMACRIQHAFRTFLIRRHIRRRLVASMARQSLAASKIQRVARYFLARQLGMRLIAAKHYEQQLVAGREHLHVYALTIQRWVRRFVVAPLLTADARVAKRNRAALIVQRFMRWSKARASAGRAREQLLRARESTYEAEEKEFAALRIQKNVRAARVRGVYHSKVKAATRIALWCRRIWSYRDAAKRRALRRDALHHQLLREREVAARTIQLFVRSRREPP